MLRSVVAICRPSSSNPARLVGFMREVAQVEVAHGVLDLLGGALPGHDRWRTILGRSPM